MTDVRICRLFANQEASAVTPHTLVFWLTAHKLKCTFINPTWWSRGEYPLLLPTSARRKNCQASSQLTHPLFEEEPLPIIKVERKDSITKTYSIMGQDYYSTWLWVATISTTRIETSFQSSFWWDPENIQTESETNKPWRNLPRPISNVASTQTF